MGERARGQLLDEAPLIPPASRSRRRRIRRTGLPGWAPVASSAVTDERLRILVTASSLDLDGTAEGSCSVKYLELLVRHGHRVRVINGADGLVESPSAWLPGLEVVDLPGPVERAVNHGLIGQKVGAARAHLTGFGPVDRARRRRWHRAIASEVEAFVPHVVITRGAGFDYTPHLAMLDLHHRPAWVAHYHDPWPLSVYPDPYRRHEGLISLRQEAASRRILSAADAVTFPSARQRDWQSVRSRVALGDRAVVVPHLGVEGGLVLGLADPWAPGGSAAGGRRSARTGRPGPLRMIHAGSLFRQRDPRPLLEALARVVATTPAGTTPPIRLCLVGFLDPKLVEAEGWRDLVDPLVACGALDLRPGNIGYVESIAELEASDVLLVFVVGTPESPQFPAKLADVFSLGQPALVVAPRASAPADLVGTASPSFVDGDAPGEFERALRSVIAQDREGTLDALVPSDEQRRSVSVEVVGAAVERSIAVARAGCGGPAFPRTVRLP